MVSAAPKVLPARHLWFIVMVLVDTITVSGNNPKYINVNMFKLYIGLHLFSYLYIYIYIYTYSLSLSICNCFVQLIFLCNVRRHLRNNFSLCFYLRFFPGIGSRGWTFIHGESHQSLILRIHVVCTGLAKHDGSICTDEELIPLYAQNSGWCVTSYWNI